jgi:UDP-N-acetylmuramoylalanine--D-glutamate ligase
MFAQQNTDDIALLGTDDRLLAGNSVNFAGTVEGFGTSPDCRARVDEHLIELKPGFAADGCPEVYALTGTLLDSRVNRYNAAAALLAARHFGCSRQGLRAGLAAYQPPEPRMTPVADICGVSFVNDSKATNVGAVIAALAGFERNVVLIAGGRDKGSDFSALQPAVEQHVRHLVLIGEAGADIGQALQGIVTMEYVDSMGEAVFRASEAAEQGDIVLLAPACASFDMFVDYGQRGRVFTRCVQELAQKNKVL